jgi:hypothetical protein
MLQTHSISRSLAESLIQPPPPTNTAAGQQSQPQLPETNHLTTAYENSTNHLTTAYDIYVMCEMVFNHCCCQHLNCGSA